MAPESRTIDLDLSASAVAEKLGREPCSFTFFQAVHLLEKLHAERDPVGGFVHPSKEVAHFRVHPSLAFPASEIQQLEFPENEPTRVTVNFIGLTGPLGVLPNPYTSLIIERLRASDTCLRDFLDIFNHRIISFFYAAWKKHRLDFSYEREEQNRFSRHVLSLIGLGTDGLQERERVPDDALIYYAGLLAQRPRSAQALRQILADYFNVPVEIEQFSGGWSRLEADSQCCLSESSADNHQLGLGAVVGDAIWNQQSRICIVLGPLKLERYSDFLPNGKDWESLQSWVRLVSNQEVDLDVRLILEREQVPACTLGAEGVSGPQLGWVSWVKNAPIARDPDDAILALASAEGGQE